MSLLLAMIIGAIIGAIGAVLLQGNYDLLIIDMCAGIVGAVLGDAIYFFASGNDYWLFTWGGLLSQIAGALLAVLLFGMIHTAAPDAEGHVRRGEKQL